MKKLTRMKLINWHRFTNETVTFGDSTLLSGENGSGKSTLLDAIQFVITCSANHFNKAAHENGKRKLTGYIRYKTGQEQHPYERTGDISAHVALEFYEEKKNRYFILGAVIDSATEGQETVARYLIDNSMLSNDMFLDGKRPRNITEFRTYNSNCIRQFVKTQAEAKKMLKQRLGRIEDKFFQLVPKALAFKPIDDIKDFVYSYVLDEKEVNIDSLRENVRTYQELETTLAGVKHRIAKLQEIEKNYNLVQAGLRNDAMYDFFLSKADLDITKQNIEELEQGLIKEKYNYQELVKNRRALQQEWQRKNKLYTDLLVELKQNSEYSGLIEQKKYLEELKEKEKEQLIEQKKIMGIGTQALSLVYKLGQSDQEAGCILQYEQFLRNMHKMEDLGEVQKLIEQVLHYKKQLAPKVQKKILECQAAIRKYTEELFILEEKIKRLERKSFSYPKEVELLKSQMLEKFVSLGRKAEPHVLCELLELKDEKWRNAVEGYLNTQRFYLLIEPEQFDVALSVYDTLRREEHLSGVGLINTAKLGMYMSIPPDSLASMVTSGNVYAQQYINFILGKVHMCQHSQELKQYSVAITPQCMRYQNHVASVIKPQNYDPPFIGQKAIKIQLELFRAQKEETHARKEMLEKQQSCLNKQLPALEIETELALQFGIHIFQDIKRTTLTITRCEEEIKELEANTDFLEKQFKVEALEKEADALNQKASLQDQSIGSCKARIEANQDRLQEAKKEVLELKKTVEELGAASSKLLPHWETEYDKLTGNRSYEQFQINFTRRKKANLTTMETVKGKMTEAMAAYKTAFDFGGPASLEAYPEYGAIYDRLVHSELLTYENKVTKAKISAEEEFREQFLSKMQENMKQAQSEFKELNKALKGIVFSNERYEFLFLPSKKYSKYYDMIMDDFNVTQGESIFAGAFMENHKEVIDELFTRLALDKDNTVKTLEEFTDYRTYMDYDIKILHDDGNYSLYSKVCEEKSGGETQTPFYVTVAASFVQLYSNNIGGEALGLIMFDEAFNNMDDERIGGVLEFLRRLPLQLVIAAPPDKLQYIGPKMDEILLVLTDKKESYVEVYRDDALRKENIDLPS